MKRISVLTRILMLLATALPAAQARCLPSLGEHSGNATHAESAGHPHADEHAEGHAHPTPSPGPDPCACHCAQFPIAVPAAAISLVTPSRESPSLIDVDGTPAGRPLEARAQAAPPMSSANPPPGPSLHTRPSRAPPLGA